MPSDSCRFYECGNRGTGRSFLKSKGKIMIRGIERILKAELYHYVNGKRISGYCSLLSGDCSGLKGYCSGLIGDCSGLSGDFDNCDISENERKKSIKDR